MIILFSIFGITIHWPWWATVIVCIAADLLWMVYLMKHAPEDPVEKDIRLEKEINEFLSDKERIEMREMLGDIHNDLTNQKHKTNDKSNN